MSTFQAAIYALMHGITEFLPISTKAHQVFIPLIFGWQPPEGVFLGALSFGSLIALLVYFRHDWASMISCLLQVIIFRKRPMTMDERLPLFLGVTALPCAIVSYYVHHRFPRPEWSPLHVCAIFAAAGLPLWFSDYFSRKTKGMYDWKWMDAAIVGIVQASSILPGWDPLSAALLAGALLNYKREPALKYAYFSLAPLLLGSTFSAFGELSFHDSMPMPDLSWLSFAVAILVSFFVSLLAIGGLLKHVQSRGIGQYVIYRWIIAGGTVGILWMRGTL